MRQVFRYLLSVRIKLENFVKKNNNNKDQNKSSFDLA